MITVGILLAYLIGQVATTNSLDGSVIVCDWRLVSYLFTIISGVFFVSLFMIPETRRYLFEKGQVDAGTTALRCVRGGGDGDVLPNGKSELQALLDDADSDDQEIQTASLSSELWQYKKPLIIGCMLSIFQQCSGVNNVMMYLTKILQNADVTNPQMYSTIAMVTQTVVTMCAVPLMDHPKFGRKPLLIIPFLGLVLSLGMFSTYFYLDDKSLTPLAIAAALSFMTFFSLGVGPIPGYVTGELGFPSSVRSVAQSVLEGITASNLLNF